MTVGEIRVAGRGEVYGAAGTDRGEITVNCSAKRSDGRIRHVVTGYADAESGNAIVKDAAARTEDGFTVERIGKA